MKISKQGIALISVVSLLCLIVVGYNLWDASEDVVPDNTDSQIGNSASKHDDVDAEDVFNFIADNDYDYYADDEYLTKSQKEYRDEAFKEAAQEFGITESEARDLYDEYAQGLGMDGSDSITESSGSTSKSYSNHNSYTDTDEPTYYYQKDDSYSAKYDDDNDGKVSEDEYMQGMSDLIDDLYEAYISN